MKKKITTFFLSVLMSMSLLSSVIAMSSSAAYAGQVKTFAYEVMFGYGSGFSNLTVQIDFTFPAGIDMNPSFVYKFDDSPVIYTSSNYTVTTIYSDKTITTNRFILPISTASGGGILTVLFDASVLGGYSANILDTVLTPLTSPIVKSNGVLMTDYSATDYLLGDVTLDGHVTAADATLLQQKLNGNYSFTHKQNMAADVAWDSFHQGAPMFLLNQSDLTYLQAYINGYHIINGSLELVYKLPKWL